MDSYPLRGGFPGGHTCCCFQERKANTPGLRRVETVCRMVFACHWQKIVRGVFRLCYDEVTKGERA